MNEFEKRLFRRIPYINRSEIAYKLHPDGLWVQFHQIKNLIDEARKELPNIVEIAKTTRTSDDARYIYVAKAQRWAKKWLGGAE